MSLDRERANLATPPVKRSFIHQVVAEFDVIGDLEASIGAAVGDGVRLARADPLHAGLRLFFLARVEERAARQHRLEAVFEVQAVGRAFQDLDSGQSHLAAADHLDETLPLDRDDSGDGVFARLSVLDLQAGQRAVLAINEANAGAEFLLFVVGIVAEAVRADHDVLAVVAHQIAMVAAVDVIPLERDPAR